MVKNVLSHVEVNVVEDVRNHVIVDAVLIAKVLVYVSVVLHVIQCVGALVM